MKFLIYIIRFLTVIKDYGVMGLLTYFIPVYWEQDCNFINNGRDLFYFRKSKHFYFHGTMWQRNRGY